MKKRNKIKNAAGVVLCLACLLCLLPKRAFAAEAGCFPACGGGYVSLVDALLSVSAEASFDYRARIAEANGYRDYRGTAGQNRALLFLLRAGQLKRPEKPLAPLFGNQNSTAFLAQERKTCKATALAMALNLLTGRNDFGTADLGGSCCRSIDGEKYLGSDGITYQGVYKTDRYAGSLSELTNSIDEALDAGIPIVAAVHSTKGGTQHHWVLILGRSGEDYLIADPACAGSGSIEENAVTLSSRGYALGLADYDAMHYGYITFQSK
jgi:hypothetical protein